MIAEIRIRGLGVIDSADIEPGPGLTCLTGETGAGKTMILTAIELLRGGKCPPALVSQERARVEAVLDVGDDVVEQVNDMGGEAADGEVILARTIPRDGRSRSFAGGAAAPAGSVAEVMNAAVVVHGQAEQVHLRSPARQRSLLDEFGGAKLAEAKGRYQEVFRQWRESAERLSRITADRAAAATEIAELQDGLAAIAAVNPQPGEDEQLRDEAERLTNVEDLLAASAGAGAVLAGDDSGGDAVALVAQAQRLLDTAARFDPKLAELAERAGEIGVLLGDLSGDVSAYAADLEVDPARLQWLQERRADLARLTRRFGGSLDDVLGWAQRAELRWAELGDEAAPDVLAQEVARLGDLTAEHAGSLTQQRRAAGAALAQAVSAELAGLAMPDARFEVRVEAADFGRDGRDEVTFWLAPHKGAEPAALGVGASGGELSRVMLAVEVALASGGSGSKTAPTAGLPTMVFDEVDAGVGGKAAVEIGRRLGRLAEHRQVIVVTHLPQVAAFADTHIRVHKDSSGSVTTTSVEEVNGEERRREIARMLAGQEDSDHALAHADELLALRDR